MSEWEQSGAWAAQLIRDTYRDVDRRRDEQFLENALIAWLQDGSNCERFLSAFDIDVVAEDVEISTQLSGSDPRDGRVDITFQFGGGEFRVELKLWAALTPAQAGPDYAEAYIVPRSRVERVREKVAGCVIAWEVLFERLREADSQHGGGIERLRAFFEGMAYGLRLVDWPSDFDQSKLARVRAVACDQFRELLAVENRSAITWDRGEGFTCLLRDSGDKISLDFNETNWWWTLSPEGGAEWEPDSLESRCDPDLTAVSSAMSDAWWSVVQSGLAPLGSGNSEIRWDDEWGFVFGRYFWSGEYAIEVMLTFGDYSDSRVLGLVAWRRVERQWVFVAEAWWPRLSRILVNEWLSEAVMVANACAEGAVLDAFDGLKFAAIDEIG